jgi:8-oxo-dGTP pyrophosphatase MutT (NUDIX family)
MVASRRSQSPLDLQRYHRPGWLGAVHQPQNADSRAAGIGMTVTVRKVYEGKVLRLNIERVTLPNGAVAELEIAHHPGGACIVALDRDGCVCLLRQFRHAAGGWITELPAGKLDEREPPLDCARRELAEETGMTAGQWDDLGYFFSSPGVFTEVIHVFLARGLTPCESAPEQHEVFEAHWLPLADALAQASDGRLQDAKTITGLLWASTRLRQERQDDRPRGPGM